MAVGGWFERLRKCRRNLVEGFVWFGVLLFYSVVFILYLYFVFLIIFFYFLPVLRNCTTVGAPRAVAT